MAGLNHIREAYEQVYSQIDERMDPEERALRRAEVADKRASRMDPKVAAKYAGSEARSAERADKKSRGKHIHGTVDEEKTVEPDPFGRPGGKHGGFKPGGGYDKGYQAMQKKLKEIESKKTTNEAKVDEKLPEHERSGARLKRYDNPSGALALGGGQQRARRAEHEERRGVKKEGRDYLGRDHGGSEEEHASNVRFGKRMEKLQGSVLGGKKETSEKKLKEAVYGGEKKEPEDTRMTVTAADQKGNTPAWKRYQAGHPGYKAAPHLTKEEMKLELIAHLRERALDAAEKREKESVFKAIKPSKLAKTYPEKSPEELKSLRYAISTSQAKKNMDTSRSDKRYGTER